MQHVLRAISGPHAGAVYVLSSRTTIGRASDCDIQILHEGVSRHHAKITLEDDGTLVVSDLSSDNGTFVEDGRVERHVLVAGEVVRVMRSRFIYEVVHTDDAQTSSLFHRKVTSGDSLRQTVHHEKTLASVRAGVVPSAASGLPGGTPAGTTAERARAYSRPQAAAPALSGARPGAPASRPAGPGGSAGVDAPEPERPTPPRGVEPGAGVGERRPRVAAAAHEARSAQGRMVTRSPEPARPDEPRAREPEPVAPTAPRGGYVALGQGRRERATVTPGTSASVSGASSARVDRAMPPSGPSGRMAPLAPSGVEHEPQSHGTSTAGGVPPSMHGTGPLGSGWIRVTRPFDAPGSMRPGATLTGVPRVGDEASEPTASPSDATPQRGTKHETAEYGAVGERQTPADGLTGPATAPVPASTPVPAASPVPASTPVPAASPAPASEDDAELDAMKTVPARRRARRSSTTPTEEVPRIRSLGSLDDDSHVKTQPRVTLVPRERGPAAPPAMAQPKTALGPAPASAGVSEPGTVSTRGTILDPDVVSSPQRPVEPSSAVGTPRVASEHDAASTPDFAPTIDAPRRLATSGSARPRARSIAYEDTLRFQRPEAPGEARPSPPPDVPQPRPHVTTAEVISALESLLPSDDDPGPLPGEPRPAARTHALGHEASLSEDARLAVADPFAIDEGELRVRQGLEDADREHEQRVGLERLVDILEYRELRLRALQSAAGDAGAVARCIALEQALQQHAPAGDDMAAMRRYHRFVCSIPAQLTHLPRGAKSTATVEIEDLSAGGARITFGEYSIGAGETVWLSIDLAQADRSRVSDPTASTVVMKARVVWSRPHEAKLGLVFAGAPQYGP